MINPKTKSINFSKNDSLQEIFSEVVILVDKIKSDKEISFFDASELSILSTEIMSHIISLLNHTIDANHNESKESPMLESCMEYQSLCSYIQNIDKFDEFIKVAPETKSH